MNKIFYNWNNLVEDINIILTRLKGQDIRGIYAIPRGGLVLGTILSNYLSIPLYINLDEALTNVENKNNILIIDDLSDSGKTMLEINKIYMYKTVTIFIKEGTQFIPNIYCRYAKKEEWICFPWEPPTKDTVRDREKV